MPYMTPNTKGGCGAGYPDVAKSRMPDQQKMLSTLALFILHFILNSSLLNRTQRLYPMQPVLSTLVNLLAVHDVLHALRSVTRSSCA
jgi:hypothetical protein